MVRVNRRLCRRDTGERGSTVPLYVLFALILFGALTVAVDSAQVFVYQRTLGTVADGGALAATDGIDEAAVYDIGVEEDDRVRIAHAEASARLDEYMQRAVIDENKAGMTCFVAEVTAAGRVTVTCNGQARLPLVNYVTIGAVGDTVDVTASAAAEGFTLQ